MEQSNGAKQVPNDASLRISLLAKRAIINSNSAPVACVITANESEVFFANASNPAHGLRFTVEEWAQVVEFVGFQIEAIDP